MGSPKIPDPPNYAAAAREGVYADLETYPLRYLSEAASRMGGRVVIDGVEYDFSGLGEADSAGVMSDQMAQTLLDIQRDMGPAFVRQRLAELEQADPQGFAARKDLFARIMAQTEAAPDRPLAEDLQRSIMGELERAGRLDARQMSEVQQAVRGGQVARGNYLGNAATAQEAGAVVQAGEGLRDRSQQRALGFLESGVTPEDVEYRRIQQSLANLGAFNEGTSPTAQFRTLSGAGNGAAPFIGGGFNSQMTNPNAGMQGANNAMALYGGQVNWQQNQVNPWIAGISTGINAANAAVNLGWGAGARPAGGGYVGDVNTPAWAGRMA
jgi:hypothetical protein